MSFFDAGWFPLHSTNWKQAGGEGVYWSRTGVGDSSELGWGWTREKLRRFHHVAASAFFEIRENHRRIRALVSAPEAWSQQSGWRCLRCGMRSNHA